MTKTVLKSIPILFMASVFCLLSGGSIVSGEPDLGYIIERTKAKQTKTLMEIKDAVCLAEYTYKEMNKNGDMRKEKVIRKRIYTKGSERSREEYLFMSINGRELTKEEREKEAEKDWKKGENEKRPKLPLTPEGEGFYNFHLIGSKIWNDMDVWIIEFEAKQKKSDYVNGMGYVLKDTFDVVYVEVAPAKSPLLVENLKITVTSSYTQGYWMPTKFEVDVRIKLSFLYYRHIMLEETYSGYKMNSQLGNSILETK